MEISLFPFQQHIKKRKYEELRNHSAVLVAAPTGSGKTVMFSAVIKQAIDNNKRVMVLVNRIELVEQTEGTLNRFGIRPRLIIPESSHAPSNCYVASVRTLMNRTLPDIDLLIVDEAHLSDFDEVISKYKAIGVKILGYSATPMRLSKKKPIKDVYDYILQEITVAQLIALHEEYPEQGLCEPIYYEAHSGDEKIKTDSKTGDYSEKEQFEYFNKKELYAGVVDSYKKFLDGQKTIVFCINREHSERTAEEFRANGIEAVSMDGTRSKSERKQVITDFKSGKFKVLTNCQLYTYGFDVKDITGVILYRQTKSLPLYLQMVGRGARPSPDKYIFTVLDHGGNIKRLGFWHQDRVWELDPKPKGGGGVAPVKSCPELKGGCGALLAASASKCKYCGYEFEIKAGEEITKDVQYRQLIDDKVKIKSSENTLKKGDERAEYVRSLKLTHREELTKLYELNLDSNGKLFYPTAKETIKAFAQKTARSEKWAYIILSQWTKIKTK